MDTFDAIATRRAIKAFDPEHRLTADEERQLLDAAIQAPTSFNIPIGKGTKDAWPKPGQLTLDEVVREDSF